MIGITKDDAYNIVDTISKAREIVFCKDCKYWIEGVCIQSSADPFECTERNADDFCSRGDKR